MGAAPRQPAPRRASISREERPVALRERGPAASHGGSVRAAPRRHLAGAAARRGGRRERQSVASLGGGAAVGSLMGRRRGGRRKPEVARKAPTRSSWALPPHGSSFSKPAFGLVYLGQGERNLGNLLKNLGIVIHIPNLLELFFGGFWISW